MVALCRCLRVSSGGASRLTSILTLGRYAAQRSCGRGRSKPFVEVIGEFQDLRRGRKTRMPNLHRRHQRRPAILAFLFDLLPRKARGSFAVEALLRVSVCYRGLTLALRRKSLGSVLT